MSAFSKMSRSISFLKQLWRNKVTVRNLLESPNYIFVRDFPPGHFYSPLPDAREVAASARTIFDVSIKELPAINVNEPRQVELLETFAKFYDDLPFSEKRQSGFRYFLDNPFFSYGDGIILGSFLQHFRPRQVIEVGSGFSSAAMLDANDLLLNKSTQFTFIEPYPERLFGLLSDKDRKLTTVEVKPVQKIDLSIFSKLEENDILFIDSSHVAKIGSDLIHIIFNILPSLKKGVLIHFHDVLWPFEYPQNWFEEGRAWNEAYFLRTFLQYNSTFEILYFNSYMVIHHSELVRKSMPLVLKSPSTQETVGNSSLWLRKTA